MNDHPAPSHVVHRIDLFATFWAEGVPLLRVQAAALGPAESNFDLSIDGYEIGSDTVISW